MILILDNMDIKFLADHINSHYLCQLGNPGMDTFSIDCAGDPKGRLFTDIITISNMANYADSYIGFEDALKAMIRGKMQYDCDVYIPISLENSVTICLPDDVELVSKYVAYCLTSVGYDPKRMSCELDFVNCDNVG